MSAAHLEIGQGVNI